MLNVLRMPLNIHREFTLSQKMFLCNIKLRGLKYPQINNKFSAKFVVLSLTRDGLNKMDKESKQNI